MRIRYCASFLLVLALLALAPTELRADFGRSSSWFNGLSEDERNLLQSRLILTGHYFALADGEFGPRTYQAITGFQRTIGEGESGVLSGRAQKYLVDEASEIYQSLGMDITEDARGQITLIVPHALLPLQSDTRRGRAYYSADNAIRLETVRKPAGEQSFSDLYRSLAARRPGRTVNYTIFDATRFVLSGTKGDRSFYMLFRNTGADSIGYSVEWAEAERSRGTMLATFLASYSFPTAFDEPIATDDYAGTGPEKGPPSPETNKPAPGRKASGSGFFVSGEGLIVTNEHVIDGCNVVSVPGYGIVRVVSSDKELDVAVLRTISKKPESWARIRDAAVELGEEVVLLGYPLSDLLDSSLNVGTGIVSSETGFAGDATRFTSNVGVQPGNSGGPILDSRGDVVGVAVGKLDDEVMMASSGNVAPSVGFAIKNTALRDFLSVFRTDRTPRKQAPAAPSVRELVQAAREFTVQVVCQY